MLLCTSSVTMLINFAVVVAYLKGIDAANRTHDYASWITAGIFVAHMALWIATATLYRTGKTGHDLWGWSCSAKAQKIQEPFKDVVNFGRYCHLQVRVHPSSLFRQTLTDALADRLMGHLPRRGNPHCLRASGVLPRVSTPEAATHDESVQRH